MEMRVIALKIYFRRLIYLLRTNSPYISGDSVADLCGTVLYPSKFRRFRFGAGKYRNKDVVFCPSDKFSELLSLQNNKPRIKTLVIGNGDTDFVPKQLNELRNIADNVFVQNLNYKVDKCHVLPIGVENLRLGRNGRKSLMRNELNWEEKIERVLIGPFSDTHLERRDLLNFADKVGPWDFQSDFISEVKYAALAGRYRFVACPRGNGLDTHRFWETLYRGSIPIVKQSIWSDLVGELGVPLIAIEEWTEEAILGAISSSNYKGFKAQYIPALWIHFWDVAFSAE